MAGHPGYLLWLRERTLLAQRFDAGNLRPEGDPAPIVEDIALNGNRAAFWTSGTGLLAYRTGGNFGKAKLVWIGRDGKRLGNAGPEDNYTSLRLSPDGKRVAVGRRDLAGYDDTWLGGRKMKGWTLIHAILATLAMTGVLGAAEITQEQLRQAQSDDEARRTSPECPHRQRHECSRCRYNTKRTGAQSRSSQRGQPRWAWPGTHFAVVRLRS